MKFHVSPRSYKPFWSVVAYRYACATCPSQLSHSSRTGTETPHLLYMILVQNAGRFHIGTNVSYRYENRSELSRTDMTRTNHELNEYRATSGHLTCIAGVLTKAGQRGREERGEKRGKNAAISIHNSKPSIVKLSCEAIWPVIHVKPPNV